MRRSSIAVLTALLVSTGAAVPLSAATADRTKPPTNTSSAPDSWGRGKLPTFELYGQIKNIPRVAKDEAHLSVTGWGYRYVGGGGNNKLTVTAQGGSLRFHDRSITRWTNLPGGCDRIRVGVGRAAVCDVPAKHEDKAFLELWPQLGNDTIDTSALPARWRTWALTDAGRDVVRGGAGRDFINTAADRDLAHGGAGDDWIRMGRNGNRAYGGNGNDKLVGGGSGDTLHGGGGNDSVGGLAGNDVLHGNAGADLLAGKVGRDIGYRDGADTLRNIDVVR